MSKGIIALVGAGPGDAGLLTLKAAQALQGADVVLYDALVSKAVLALVRSEAELIPVGKKGHGLQVKQSDINAQMVAQARQGRRVVRLKGGDPLIFSRAGEELAAAREAGIAVEIIPGITAAQAAAASLGIPLTHRESARRLQYVTGHDQQGALPEDIDWRALADPNATTVVYMAKKTLAALSEAVLQHGLSADTPAVAVVDASLATQVVISGTIASLPAKLAIALPEGPVVVLIGRVFASVEPAA